MYDLTTFVAGDNYAPFFIAGGNELAFTNYYEFDGSFSIRYINLATDDITSIYTADYLIDDAYAGCVSSDDRYIAYRDANTSELVLYDRDHDSKQVIAEGDAFWGQFMFYT